MKKLNNCLLAAMAILLAACSEGNKFDYNENVAFITGTEQSPVIQFAVEDTPAAYAVTLSTSHKVDSDVPVEFAYDASAVDAYNASKGTKFYALPESAVTLEGTSATIQAGKSYSSAVKVSINSTEGMEEGRTYVVPVSVKSTGGLKLLEPSKTVFLRISRTMHFTALNMSNPSLYSNYIVPEDKIVPLPNFTFEVKCYCTQWKELGRLCALRSTHSCMLRFGELGTDNNSLQWVSPGGNVLSKTRFSLNQWYHIALTYDGNKYIMYVDGVKDAELVATEPITDLNFQGFEIGMSWTSYRYGQRFWGRMAEVRIWNRALTAKELSQSPCAADPTAEGLIAYWKMNEGEGHIFHDATGHGYDMDWSNTKREVNEGQGMIPEDCSGAVSWLSDDNNKCNQ